MEPAFACEQKNSTNWSSDHPAVSITRLVLTKSNTSRGACVLWQAPRASIAATATPSFFKGYAVALVMLVAVVLAGLTALLILAVSYLFDLTVISAVLWCIPLIPAWWLVTREARIKTKANALNNAFPCSDQIPRKAPCV